MIASAAGAAAFGSGLAFAQPAAFPSRPIKLVVAWPPGGGTDSVARAIADRLSVRLGQSVVVDNRPGANAKVGTQVVQQSAPDGYTLLLHADYQLPPVAGKGPLAAKYSSFEPLKGLEPVGLVGKAPYMLVTTNGLPANSVSELVAYARKNSGKLNYGSFGTGSIAYLLTELLNMNEGISTVEIPYQGAAPLLTALTAGQIDFAFVVPSAGLPLVKAGRLKGLAVLGDQRISGIEVPTMGEAGTPTFVGGSLYGILAPANTPRPIVERINTEIVASLTTPELKQSFDRLNVLPFGSSADGMGKAFHDELTKRRQLASRLGIDIE